MPSEYLLRVLALDTTPRMLPLQEAEEREALYALAARNHFRRVNASGVFIGGIEATWRVWCETARIETIRDLRQALERLE